MLHQLLDVSLRALARAFEHSLVRVAGSVPMLRQAFTRMLKRYLATASRTLDQERANHVPMGQHTTVAAAIRQAFPQPDADAAHQTLVPCRRPAKRALAQARCADGRERTR